MKVLVTGVKGQLGYDVVNELVMRGHDAVGVDIDDMDITDEKQVCEMLQRERPDAVIHCAAWTAVDAAEDNASKVKAVNVDGTAYIADECKKLDCKMMYISTDYVYGDYDNKPWNPDVQKFEPANVYGMTKLQGEYAVKDRIEKYFIVRISWVFGKNGNNFIKTMLRLGKTHEELRVVNDQIGTPTYSFDLARLLVDMIETDKYGCYNATNEGGYISWADFAKEIFKQANMNVKITPVTTEEYGLSKAYRPKNSRMDKSKLTANGFELLPIWQDALKRYLEEINE